MACCLPLHAASTHLFAMRFIKPSLPGCLEPCSATHNMYCVHLNQHMHSTHAKPCMHVVVFLLNPVLQVGLSSEDMRLRVLTDLVEQVISEPLYDTLRTKQQLGYTVSSGARLTHGVTGFCVVMVSAAFDAATVEERIEAFLDDYQNNKLKVCLERAACVIQIVAHTKCRCVVVCYQLDVC